MKTYLVTYTLSSFNDNYARISERLKGYSKWARLSPHTWLIQTEDSVSEVRSELKLAINENGTILVIDVSASAWATFAVSKNVTNWMKENL